MAYLVDRVKRIEQIDREIDKCVSIIEVYTDLMNSLEEEKYDLSKPGFYIPKKGFTMAKKKKAKAKTPKPQHPKAPKITKGKKK